MKRISMEKLINFGEGYLKKIGVPDDNARYLSKVIVEAEAFRLSTHGLVQFAQINATAGKTLDPKKSPTIEKDKGPIAVIDGRECFGNLCIKVAKELARAKAKEFGIGFAMARNTNWIGGLGIHLVDLAEEGLLAQLFAQSAACKDCAPFGGYDPRFSTNPVAMAIPTDGDPIVGDFSTATMSLGGAMSLIQKGEKAKDNRFLDKNGKPTNDPGVIKDEGTLMFMGCGIDGHKGFALSLWIEALVAMSGGSANNQSLPNLQSFILLVLDPGAFAGREYFAKEMKRFTAHVRSSRPRPGFDRVRFPGESGLGRLRDCRANGLPLDDGKIDMLKKLAGETGVEFPA